MKTYAIRLYPVNHPQETGILFITSEIKILGYELRIDPESNTVTYWIATDMPQEYIERIKGVESVVLAR